SAMEAFSPVMALPFTLFFVVLMYTTYVTARRHYRAEYEEPGERPYFAITRRNEESGDDGT
ncbi:MAG: BCCT family transporter, partial [Halalkalicoccus sp.]|nr:BCCT family transporter [Halalkalicoccus sp.]